MNKTRLEISRTDIIEYFNNLPEKVFRLKLINEIISDNRRFWRLSDNTGAKDFILFLQERAKLQKIELEFPSRKETIYTWGEVTKYKIALSIKENSYLSHYSAMHLHGLTDQIPKTIYANFEQPPKHLVKGSLQQGRIDWAFKRKPRMSNNIARIEDLNICLLNGMHTGQLGVIELDNNSGKEIKATNIERTLIDITVRPFYAGGVFEVLKAYQRAKDKVQINKLAGYLNQLNYIYPYHQAIGFYLEKAGYRRSLIDLIRKLEMKYDFYLTYDMKKPLYSLQWKLFYPEGF
jgi:hypothetical protein